MDTPQHPPNQEHRRSRLPNRKVHRRACGLCSDPPCCRHQLSQSGHPVLFMAARNGHLEVVRALVEVGADVNAAITDTGGHPRVHCRKERPSGGGAGAAPGWCQPFAGAGRREDPAQRGPIARPRRHRCPDVWKRSNYQLLRVLVAITWTVVLCFLPMLLRVLLTTTCAEYQP